MYFSESLSCSRGDVYLERGYITAVNYLTLVYSI